MQRLHDAQQRNAELWRSVGSGAQRGSSSGTGARLGARAPASDDNAIPVMWGMAEPPAAAGVPEDVRHEFRSAGHAALGLLQDRMGASGSTRGEAGAAGDSPPAHFQATSAAGPRIGGGALVGAEAGIGTALEADARPRIPGFDD
jgi:hypothetical protein